MKFSVALASTALAIAFAKPQWSGSVESTEKHHHKHHHRHTRSPPSIAPVVTGETPSFTESPVDPTQFAPVLTDMVSRPDSSVSSNLNEVLSHRKPHHRHTRSPPATAPVFTGESQAPTDLPVDPTELVEEKRREKLHHRHTRSPRTVAPVFTGTPESSDLPVYPTGIAELKNKPHHKHHHRHTRRPPTAGPETTVEMTGSSAHPSPTAPVVTIADITEASTNAPGATAEAATVAA
uniref:Secreted protein n=1 Tax=Haemonchus contortus TaxID=6289 RepID=A0A7I5EC75_HAECO